MTLFTCIGHIVEEYLNMSLIELRTRKKPRACDSNIEQPSRFNHRIDIVSVRD